MLYQKWSVGRAVAAVLCLLFLAGCAAGRPGLQTAPDPANCLAVTDMAGREVLLDAPAETVVVLSAADCEIVYALGAGDKLVGRGEFCDYPAQVQDLPVLQSGENANLEQIIALAPDVIILSAMGRTDEPVAALEAAGIPVAVSDAQDIAGVYKAMEMIGALVGKDAEAAELAAQMQTRLSAIQAKVAEVEQADQPTVYFEVSPLEHGLWTAGSGTFMNEIAQGLGLVNLFADVNGWVQVSQEQVIERNPDYIVTVTMYFVDGPLPEQEILSRTGWQGIAAVQNGRVYHAGSDEITRPGPRLADAAEILYRYIYE